MTTDQLIESCAHDGVEMSVTKLARWVRGGLIPAHLRKRHGRGRGKGAEWLWERECLPRALIIGGTLADGDPSLYRAARVEAAIGYAPSAAYVRRMLVDTLDFFERSFTRRQSYLTDERPVRAKRQQLAKNLRRKGATMPEPLVQYFATMGSVLHGLASSEESSDQDVVDIVERFAPFLSFAALRQRILLLDDATLLARYEEAGRALPRMLPLLITAANVLLLPFLREHVRAQGHPTDALPASIDLAAILEGVKHDGDRVMVAPGNPAGTIRMVIALLHAAVPDAEGKWAKEWTPVAFNAMQLLADYLGVVLPADFFPADEGQEG
jgi:hypothetical protein